MSNKEAVLIRYHYQGVEDLFDEYADTFDEHLTKGLRYSVPKLMKEHLDAVLTGEIISDHVDNNVSVARGNVNSGNNHSDESLRPNEKEEATRFRRCLDLGCGTGLAGVVFRDQCQYLEGNDISRLMVEKCRTREGVYDKVTHNNLMNHLRRQRDESFDLILSADVVMYLHDDDLAAMIASVRRVLEPGGMFVFSTEAHDGSENFVRLESERFAHSRKYVLGLVEDGFEVKSVNSVLCRMDEGKEIRGDIFVLKRQ
eukprot:CAMPEP_0197441204 /NCGR_PEP_ID=MMETSP1175-20131217/7534_1 /TAXON_ID=1003142 /ORGANISM="Triceratium dubium, Strain CCMP147" /LENGTH=255 /DNA_ID=CAMNT_0042971449 /DNA_START=53 /DNA_END=820 /DNA_ORIENTATION=+